MSVFNLFMYDGRGRMVKDTIKIFDCRNTTKFLKHVWSLFNIIYEKGLRVMYHAM